MPGCSPPSCAPRGGSQALIIPADFLWLSEPPPKILGSPWHQEALFWGWGGSTGCRRPFGSSQHPLAPRSRGGLETAPGLSWRCLGTQEKIPEDTGGGGRKGRGLNEDTARGRMWGQTGVRWMQAQAQRGPRGEEQRGRQGAGGQAEPPQLPARPGGAGFPPLLGTGGCRRRAGARFEPSGAWLRARNQPGTGAPVRLNLGS